MKPAYSVITPVYNCEAFILRCYEMLRGQTFTDWEWVVVDDGSTDRTRELVSGIDDPRVRLVAYQPNMGRGYGRTAALKASRGEWIVVWDADDMYFLDRLERLNEAREGGYDFACSYCVMVDNDLNFKSVRGFTPFEAFLPRLFVHLTLAARRDVMLDVGYSPFFRTAEDVTMVYTLAGNYRGLWIEDALTICQEDREVHLEKAIASNESQLLQVEQMSASGALRGPRGAHGKLIRRLQMKLRVLGLMRLQPSLYLKSVGARASGGTMPGWTLSAERLAFLEALKARWGGH